MGNISDGPRFLLGGGVQHHPRIDSQISLRSRSRAVKNNQPLSNSELHFRLFLRADTHIWSRDVYRRLH